ncbi:hypothetical protein GLAREA_06183 [Glarea lozoyensis ATCC 20868]|uniref:Ams2/SPT21 N-terminal domain-containing protein n=1 Tax=Glarea lozoyensis (strain ATCC 20868 / MF5171) TaxID=1116229 RepID=S3DM68_GLAL2|nr:uncharacterized protein GLAREA_06183 [Glarea lozoyensis ATCC 20868]EPE33171.1 hypothetical protein GLAREA_06183 [Glarea lozoyensis ATCC 20868]
MSQGPSSQRTKGSQDSATGETTGGNEDGVCVRKMRLKVLYTFDDQNKTNCLARWPHVLEIQTVAMDETTSIGVIELKTCIQAIVQCSPELVARLGQDYTVYAPTRRQSYTFTKHKSFPEPSSEGWNQHGSGQSITQPELATPAPSRAYISGRCCSRHI